MMISILKGQSNKLLTTAFSLNDFPWFQWTCLEAISNILGVIHIWKLWRTNIPQNYKSLFGMSIGTGLYLLMEKRSQKISMDCPFNTESESEKLLTLSLCPFKAELTISCACDWNISLLVGFTYTVWAAGSCLVIFYTAIFSTSFIRLVFESQQSCKMLSVLYLYSTVQSHFASL